jgi:alpha-glucosidase (family GH31 glycosyl hydrolase)
MFLKYTKTQVYKQNVLGIPFIQPLFYHYPEDHFTYYEVDKQYMYGPAVKVNIGQNADTEDPAYFPRGRWCSVFYYDSATECFWSDGQSFTNRKSYVYLKEGSIVPL